MKNIIESINAQIASFQADAEKAAAGNKAAGIRARKASLELTKLFKEFRAKSVEAAK